MHFAETCVLINGEDPFLSCAMSHQTPDDSHLEIDYQIITPELKKLIRKVGIYNDEVFSDHAPLLVDYDCQL